MPHFTQQIPNLALIGPNVTVTVGLTARAQAALLAIGKAIPATVTVVAQIDTGAVKTVLNPATIQALGLTAVGTTPIVTPSTSAPVNLNLFDVAIVFPSGVVIPERRAIEAPLKGQAIQALIGRDILSTAILTYIGPMNQFTLSF